MSSIVTFIDGHDSGKSRLVGQVVSELKKLGYRVAVVKSSSGLDGQLDTLGTGYSIDKETGADCLMLLAPDQMLLQTQNSDLSLRTLAHRYFPDVDIVIGEGFAKAKQIPKIEVHRKSRLKQPDKINGVIAVVSDLEGVAENYVFRLDEAEEIALFIEKRFITGKKERDIAALLVNGNNIPLKGFIQQTLAGSVHGFVKNLKLNKDIKEIELRINVRELEK